MPTPQDVKALFDSYPPPVRAQLLGLRAIILAVAAEEDVGPVEETLKWGQPAYLCTSGTTIRIDLDETHGGAVALYVNCKTTLVDEWRERFSDLMFGGTRSLHLSADSDLDDIRLRMCIADALTYRRRGRNKGRTAR
jgi:hypothetical protein